MVALVQANSTYAQIEIKVRRLLGLPGESQLASTEIQRLTNTVYSQDFPYAIKLDQMRSVYTILTQPNIDRYPLDVNFDQGVRAPMYVDGIQGGFYKDRQQFFSVWPKFSTLFQPISGDGVTQIFNFTIPGPFLSKEVTLGGVDISGAAITVTDDGFGNLQLWVPNGVTSQPLQNLNPPQPGMYNINTGNPGLYTITNIGTVNYVTGQFAINFALGNVTPIAGQNMTLWVSQYTTGRPISLLFWNNEFVIRPVPKITHKITVETFLTPVQFLQTTDTPILNQWWQYLAYLVAQEFLREAQDIEGVQNLEEGRKRQEGLVLERQGVEELFTPSPTVFNSVSTYSTGPWGNSGSASW
jgi:hypothetical protein